MASTEAFDYAPSEFALGHVPTVSEKETIAAGADLVAGSVLGVVTASGKYVLSDDGASDGSETPVAILAVDAAAASVDVDAPVFKMGLFASDKLTYGGTHTAATVKAALDGRPLFIADPLDWS